MSRCVSAICRNLANLVGTTEAEEAEIELGNGGDSANNSRNLSRQPRHGDRSRDNITYFDNPRASTMLHASTSASSIDAGRVAGHPAEAVSNYYSGMY